MHRGFLIDMGWRYLTWRAGNLISRGRAAEKLFHHPDTKRVGGKTLLPFLTQTSQQHSAREQTRGVPPWTNSVRMGKSTVGRNSMCSTWCDWPTARSLAQNQLPEGTGHVNWRRRALSKALHFFAKKMATRFLSIHQPDYVRGGEATSPFNLRKCLR